MSESSEQMEWMTLETFATAEEARALAALLQENALESNVINDANVGGDPLGLDFQNRGASSVIVRVRAKDIESARRILEAAVKAAVTDADEASLAMFESFSDEDLLEVLQKPDEWNPENVLLSRKILASHGKEYSDADLQRFFDERLAALRAPVPVKVSSGALSMVGCILVFVIAGVNFLYLDNVNYLYLLCIAFLISCLALIAGLNWTYRKKRLPNGEKIFVFSKRMRLFSFCEMVLAALSLAAVIIDIAIRTM